MKTRDIDIRNILHYQLKKDHNNEPDTLILDELVICQGDSRIDVAVINGSINGYEIKSESDTLERLPRQAELYNKVFDTVTILTASRYIEEVSDIIPNWWGIVKAEMDIDGQVELFTIREPRKNKDIEPLALAQLLWKDEAIEILKGKGLHKGLLSKPRGVLWQVLADKLPLSELQDAVREKLKSRETWRVH